MTATLGVAVSRAGDPPFDFDAWVRPHLPAMARLAARLAPDGDRDDVVQEALTRAWRKQSTYDDARGSAQSWLLAIVADQARKARRRRPLTLVAPAETFQPDHELDDAIRRLAARQRLAVELHYFVGLSVAECADVMACAEGTVKSTLSDARARLKTMLGDDHG